MALSTLNDALIDQIEGLYSAETQLLEALPRVAAGASDPRLREAIEEHLDQTRGHVERLRTIFRDVGANSPTERCEGIAGLLAEGEEAVNAACSGAAKDGAIIAAVQRIERYEIAAYGIARSLADELGLLDIKDVLSDTLDEEAKADARLTKIARCGLRRGGVNADAATR